MKFSHSSGRINGFEFDLNVTKDGEVVVFHDQQDIHRVLKRKAGSSKTEKIAIDSLSLKEIKSYSFTKGNAKETVPTFDELINLIMSMNKNLQLMIEVKVWNNKNMEIVCNKIVEVFKKYPILYKTSVVGSFNPIVLSILKRVDPAIVTNLLFETSLYMGLLDAKDHPNSALFNSYAHVSQYKHTVARLFSQNMIKSFVYVLDFMYNSFITSLVAMYLGVGVLSFHYKWVLENVEKVKSLQSKGYEIFSYTVNDSEIIKKLTDMNVSICTDNKFTDPHLKSVHLRME